MEVQAEKLDTHEAMLTIAFDEATIKQVRREVADKLSRAIRLPGFRPGMAPQSAVISAMGGEEAFMSEVTEALAQKFYAKAIDQAKIEPYGPGSIEKVDVDPVRMQVRVPLEPEVDLKDYKSIRVAAPVVTVEPAEVEARLAEIREENAVIQTVERPAQAGDQIQATVEGKAEDRTVLMIRDRKVVLAQDNVAVPGLVEHLVGMTAGEEKDVDLVMPEDFEREDLRGKTINTHIKVAQVSSRTLPELDDNLALAASSFSTLAEMRDDVTATIRKAKEDDARRAYEDQVLGTFTDLSALTLPPTYLEDRANEAVEDVKGDISRSGYNFDDWLKLQGQTIEQIRDELRPSAERRGRRGLVMRALAKAEALGVDKAEVNAAVEEEINHQVEHHGADRKIVTRVFKAKENLDNIANQLLSRKVIDRMVAIARGE